jgi:hypothetical protein
MKIAKLFVVSLSTLIIGVVLGIKMEHDLSTPKDLWSLCQASPTVIWKSGNLEVRQNPREHDYSCLMYLDGQGNLLPVKVYKKGAMVASKMPVEAIRDPALANGELAAEMSSL